MLRSIRFVACMVALLGAGSAALAAQQTANWTGGIGSWTSAGAWSTGTVPNNTGSDTYIVNIDNGNAAASQVSLYPTSQFGATGATIDALGVDADDTLVVGKGTLSIKDELALAGMLEIGNTSSIELPPNAVLDSGTIHFSEYSPFARVAASSGTLTLEPGVTIRGGDRNGYLGWMPSIGSPTTPLISRSHLVSNLFYQGFTIAGSTIGNQGGLEVSNYGIIGINTTFTLDSIGPLVNNGGSFAIMGTLENTGRTFRVDNASGGWFLHGTIRGGTVETGDGRELIVGYLTTAKLDNVVINGRIDLASRLVVPAGQSFSGTGEIVFAGADAIEGSGQLYAESGTTTIGPGMTIRGGVAKWQNFSPFDSERRATIGHGSDLVNHGKIRADLWEFATGPQIIRLAGNTIWNNGTLEVTEISELWAFGKLVFTPGGKLVIDGGGVLQVSQDLDLAGEEDYLKVLSLSTSAPYDDYLIATYAGALAGTFSHVTPGIVVDYSTLHEIRISGTPVPEPSSILMAIAAGIMSATCRRAPRG